MIATAENTADRDRARMPDWAPEDLIGKTSLRELLFSDDYRLIAIKGEPAADFAIHGPEMHGLANFVGLYGIESPGLTSSLAIGSYIAELLSDS